MFALQALGGDQQGNQETSIDDDRMKPQRPMLKLPMFQKPFASRPFPLLSRTTFGRQGPLFHNHVLLVHRAGIRLAFDLCFLAFFPKGLLVEHELRDFIPVVGSRACELLVG